MKILASLDETMKENTKRKRGEKRKKELKGEMGQEMKGGGERREKETSGERRTWGAGRELDHTRVIL